MKGDPHPMRTSAVIDGDYRYSLTRTWDSSKDKMGWVMLNPSTADATEDDPTIRRCISFARRENFGGIVVMNLYALRSRDPKALWKHHDPIGRSNNSHLATINIKCPMVVAAWGNNAEGVHAEKVRNRFGENWFAFGLSKRGQPVHPLYQRNDSRIYLMKDLFDELD